MLVNTNEKCENDYKNNQIKDKRRNFRVCNFLPQKATILHDLNL